ncbi:hypothetical protein [Halorubrum sp. JWXQ-INN 858]|uniref:hypothetical protein n=1 Tax=Halorubrum sp. JWXQ-INN 858 TaxID=2690782 RepID=UPI001358C41C|nr:hypothetical protein [Halorubrum sp. JWXQ-INN 858]
MTVAVAVALAMGMGGVTAQENDTETNVTDAVELVESDAAGDTLENQQSIRMGEHTEIVGWEFTDGRVHVAIDTDRTQRVTISDGAAGVGDAGATRIPQVSERIYGGDTTVVTMPVETVMGGQVVAVTLGGESVRLSTEMDDSGDDPFQYFGGESGLFSGMLLAVITSIGAAGYVLWREDSGVIKA